jgi:hypothetical protein
MQGQITHAAVLCAIGEEVEPLLHDVHKAASSIYLKTKYSF